jgi:outer membrane protein OmpA-like peptidoglycan-associated protein
MKNIIKTAAMLTVCSFALSAPAMACHHENLDEHNVVRDVRGNVVKDVRGNCVYTKWKDGSDRCTPAPVADGLTLNERTIYFGFDSATLTPEGVYKLNRLLGKLAATDKKWNATIIGHADKLGDAGYNQALSARRAEAVRKYLVTHGLKANIGAVTHEGENAPVTTGCEGAPNAIGCLQPDRRVEIKLTAE